MEITPIITNMEDDFNKAVAEKLRFTKSALLIPLVQDLLKAVKAQGFTAEDLQSAVDQVCDDDRCNSDTTE